MDEEWRLHAERRLNRVETRTAVDEVHRDAVERRLSRIEDNLRWLIRMVIGGLVGAFITFILRGGLFP